MLREALVGRLDAEHTLIVGQVLADIDPLDEEIDRLSAVIEERIAPFARQRDLLMTVRGVKRRSAETLIAEIGVDVTTFPTAKHLSSWAGLCPGNDQSAGKRRSGKTRNRSNWLRLFHKGGSVRGGLARFGDAAELLRAVVSRVFCCRRMSGIGLRRIIWRGL